MGCPVSKPDIDEQRTSADISTSALPEAQPVQVTSGQGVVPQERNGVKLDAQATLAPPSPEHTADSLGAAVMHTSLPEMRAETAAVESGGLQGVRVEAEEPVVNAVSGVLSAPVVSSSHPEPAHARDGLVAGGMQACGISSTPGATESVQPAIGTSEVQVDESGGRAGVPSTDAAAEGLQHQAPDASVRTPATTSAAPLPDPGHAPQVVPESSASEQQGEDSSVPLGVGDAPQRQLGQPRKNISSVSKVGTEASSRDFADHDDASSVALSELSTGDVDSSSYAVESERRAQGTGGRRLPDRHASMPSINSQRKVIPEAELISTGPAHGPPLRTASLSHGLNAGASTSMASSDCSTPATALSALDPVGKGPGSTGSARVLKSNPSRLGVNVAAIAQRTSVEVADRSPSYVNPAPLSGAMSALDSRTSVPRGGLNKEPSSSSSLHASASLATLQKTVESLMQSDSSILQKVHSSMRGISSLAKETTDLAVGRDATGATCINQYVVVKTLGRGSFGKVKLCLNTLDGCLYAIKMVNRSFIVKQLQKPSKGLRRRVPIRNTSGAVASGTTAVTASTGVSPSTGTDAGTARVGLASVQTASDTGAAAPSARRAVVATQDMVFNTSTGGLGSRMSIDEGSSPLNSVMREIAVLKKMDHPNVVKLHEVIDPPGASYMMLVMEYMERGPVLETKTQLGFSSFPERIARDYFRQACAGLDYLHYNHVVHGDLKPENLLVNAAGQLKIGDFGSARMMSDATANSKVSCTPAFQPPEALAQPGSEDPHLADVWALGVCLYCFIFGRLPFTGSCLLDISNAIRNDEVRFPAEQPISADLTDLLTRMLAKDPAQRPSLQLVMGHAWVTEKGASPLPSLKHLITPPKLVEVSRNEAQAAIDRSSLVSLIRARLKEKTFTPGEWIFREGDEAHCIFMIMSGVVEITTTVTAAHGEVPVEEQSFTVDLDESFTWDYSSLAPAVGLNLKDGKLHIDREKATALRERMRGAVLGKATEYVTEVKGPGQVIGDVGLDKSAVARHRHGARARDHVTVVKLTEESFLKAVMQQATDGGAGAGAGGDDTDFAITRTMDDVDSGNQPGGSTGLTTIVDTDVADVSSL